MLQEYQQNIKDDYKKQTLQVFKISKVYNKGEGEEINFLE